jgi:hypothetical protein
VSKERNIEAFSLPEDRIPVLRAQDLKRE